jgi:hypothetical protein
MKDRGLTAGKHKRVKECAKCYENDAELYSCEGGYVCNHLQTRISLPGRVLSTGLELPEGLSIEKWLIVGAQLQSAGRALMWWLGDWWLYGENRYGEAASQAAEVDCDPKTLSNAGWVAKRFEFSRRRENLSWGHHAEVASLLPEQQDELLDLASRDSLSVHELRRAVRRSRLLRTTAAEPPPGKFRVIYADPPWRYHDKLVDGYGAAEHHYTTLSIADLCAWPVRDKVEDNAVLFLWVTCPLWSSPDFVDTGSSRQLFLIRRWCRVVQ